MTLTELLKSGIINISALARELRPELGPWFGIDLYKRLHGRDGRKPLTLEDKRDIAAILNFKEDPEDREALEELRKSR